MKSLRFGSYSTSYRQEMRLIRTKAMAIWFVIMSAALIYLPWVMTQHQIFGMHLTRHETLNMNMTQINFTLLYVVGALGLNLLTGYTGLISIGNAAFYAIGAMVAASVGIKWMHLPFLVVVLTAGLAGAIVGALVGLPALRIRGIYLLLGTLALHFIMLYSFLKFQADYFGIVGVIFNYPKVFGWRLNTDMDWYFFLLAFAAIALLLVKNILRTRHGRAFIAVRDHPIAASAAGINVSQVRVLSFSISSFIICASGATYVWYLGAATQDNFQLSLAIAFTITPWAAIRVLRRHAECEENLSEAERSALTFEHDHAPGDWFTRLYHRVMGPLLDRARWRWVFLGGILALLLGSVALVGLGKVEVKMLPFDNKSEFQIVIDAPEGTTLEQTTAVAREIAAVIRREPEVRDTQI